MSIFIVTFIWYSLGMSGFRYFNRESSPYDTIEDIDDKDLSTLFWGLAGPLTWLVGLDIENDLRKEL
jgi:hypothetical protein